MKTGSQRGVGVGEWLLLAVAVSWGLTFFSTKLLLETLPATDFLTTRFAIAALVLIAISPKSLRMPKAVLWRGAVLGTVFAVAQLTQTFGLQHVAASASGFITGLYVVFTPLLGVVLFKARPRPLLWVAVLLATAGLAVLSIKPGGGAGFGIGEWQTLASALLWGVHITLVGRWSRPQDVMSLTIVQTSVGAIIFAAGGLRDGLTLPSSGVDWAWMLYFAVVVGAAAEFAQLWAQARVEASKAAVLMVTEPLWAALFAVLFGGESVTWRLLAGGGLMIVAMVLSVRSSNGGVPSLE
ncbi:MAG: DMT family transporter [Propionibacteriaceae bacterium]|nr:DMT family transporter [Propionibacteriaceae bacterium]